LIDITLDVFRNEFVFISGPSGAGKSTIVNLLLRFAENYSGSISIGEKELRSNPKADWRNMVSWMPQKPYLFQSNC
jgi:ABC-type multidrug transport system fused ATPase/permease subunit